jgi:hypothetical protein
MGAESGEKHVLSCNKIVQSFVQGQWMGIKFKGICNGQITWQ